MKSLSQNIYNIGENCLNFGYILNLLLQFGILSQLVSEQMIIII